MNTKHILFAIATLVLLFAVSCQRDELQGGSISGEEVSVSISAVMPEGGEPVVRSATDPGDGSDVNRCIMSIYLADEGLADGPILYADKVIAQVSGKTAVFPDQRLVSGHKYRFVFWADYVTDNSSEDGRAADLHYDTQNFPTVSFNDEAAYKSNDDTRDAFFLSEVVKVSGPSTQSFELRRPFGQLNIITNDWGAIPDEAAAQLRPAKVKLTFNGVPNTIDLLTGEVSDAADILGEAVEVSKIAQDGDAKHLSFDYILAKPDDQTILSGFTMDFLADDGNTKVTDTYTFTSIPVQRNYQTNVRGNLLTDRTGVEIEVVPEFDGLLPEEVNDAETLIAALQNGGYVKFTSDITVTDATIAPAGTPINIDLGGHTLTFESDVASLEAYNSTVTISGGVVEAMNIPKTTGNAVNDLLHVLDNGTIILDEVTLRTSAGGVGVNSGIENGEVVIRNSEIDVAAYALSTNASAVPENLQIELENSSFKGSTAVLINVPCTLRMNYCDVMGKNAAAFLMRGGNATIENSTITLNYTDGDGETIGDYFQDLEWNTGNMVNVAALTAGNKKQGSYQYSTTIDMKNTVVEVAGPYADYLPAMYVNANQGEGLGVTITYDDECEIIGGIEIGSGNVTVNGEEMTTSSQIMSVSEGGDLAKAFKDLGTGIGQIQHLQVTLAGDIDLSQVAFQDVPAGTSVSMDLSDYTATLPKRNLLTSGALSLRNGNLSDPSGAGIGCLSGGSVSLDEVQYDAEGWGCIFVTQNAENTNISIKNSTINGGYYAVTSNASANPVASSTIVLENSTFTADESAMMINIPSDITVTDCSFTGGWQAVFLRGGSAEFTDCRINLVMDQSYGDWPEKHVKADETWADGNQAETAAMLIGNRCVEGSASYNYPTSVMLRNTTFSIEGNNGGGGKTTDNTPAVSIWSRVEEGNGATFGYDAATKSSIDAIGTGLVKNNDGINLTIVEL